MIDWTNSSSHVTEHFTVKDCLYLHNWNRLASLDDGVDFDKILELCQALEKVRSVLGVPMNIHCMFRSAAYNLEQGILRPTGRDVHAMSMAADFDCGGMSIQAVKDTLEPLLVSLDIRMERGTSTWVHLDLHAPGPSGRYFTA